MNFQSTLCISKYDNYVVTGDVDLPASSASPDKAFDQHLHENGLNRREIIHLSVHLHRYQDLKPAVHYFRGLNNAFTGHSSNHIGYIYVSRALVQKQLGVEKITSKLRLDVIDQLLHRLEQVSNTIATEIVQ